MTISSADYGTKTATGGEDTLATETSAAVYVLEVDTSNMAASDELTLRIYTKNQSTSSYVLAAESTFTDAQTEKQKISDSFLITDGIQCTLEQSAGTMRSFEWNLKKIG